MVAMLVVALYLVAVSAQTRIGNAYRTAGLHPRDRHDMVIRNSQWIAESIPPPGLQPAENILKTCNTHGNESSLTISPTPIGTTWRGWGTSLAWFANYIGALPDPQLHPLLDLLFKQGDDSCLGLTYVRYNIGGGFNPSLSPQLVNSWRGMPGFQPSPSSPFTWSADSRQIRVLAGAKARGATYFEAFSNSPPWWMTFSGDVAGLKQSDFTLLGNGGNLRPDMHARFVDYLTSVVQQFAIDPALNVTFDSLEPFNEPIASAWFSGNSQEGCRFSPEDMSSIIRLTRRELGRKGLGERTKLAAYDESTTPTLLSLRKLSAGSRLLVHKLNVHGYSLTQSYGVPDTLWSATPLALAERRARVLLPGREVWMSEWGPIRVEGDDMDLGLYMARRIVEFVNILKVSAFAYWQIIDPSPSWTVIQIPYTNGPNDPLPVDTTPTLTKKFWVLKHFTAAAVPGSKPLRIPRNECRHGIVAFHDPAKTSLTIVVVNQEASDYTIKLSFRGSWQVERNHSLWRVRRTSRLEDYKDVAISQVLTGGRFVAAQQSVTSITLPVSTFY